jgi:YVTN family beta-propeller protein
MSAADRLYLQELLPAVMLGIATPEERRQVLLALESDAELRREAHEFELALAGLGATEAVFAPPAGLKAKVMAQIRAETSGGSQAKLEPIAEVAPVQIPTVTRLEPVVRPVQVQPRNPLAFLVGGLGLAAAVAGLMVLRSPAIAAMPDASVVANTANGGLVVANNGARATPVTFIAADGARRNVSFKLDKPASFTRAVSNQGLSYMLDAANQKLFIIDEAKGEMIDAWPVPAGASGVAVDGDTVVVMSAANGTALTFRKNGVDNKTMVEARISKANPKMPLEEFMDAAVIAGNRAYVTHHESGMVSELDVSTGKERARFAVGKKPVSLAVDGSVLYVLDLNGTLYKLERETGKVLGRLTLEGTPDRLTLAPGVAYLSDRAGFITAVKTEPLQVLARKKLADKLMDLTPMPDGHIAVAAADKGVMILDDKLEQFKKF